MNWDSPYHIGDKCYHDYTCESYSNYPPRFRVVFSRGEMQFSVELSASDERNAVYKATKAFTKYVPNTELWGVFKVERV